MMLFKILVLDTDHRLFEQFGDLIALKVIGVLFGQRLRDQILVSVIDLTRL